MNRNIELAKNKAKTNNIDGKIEISDKQNKRFKITNKYGTFHFGLYPFKIGTFIDHGDIEIRGNWRKRHEKILKNGSPAYLNKKSPAYYSYNILW